MNAFDIQILQAVKASYDAAGVASYDLEIHEQGRVLFGEDWGGVLKQGKEFQHSPLLSMRCGMLRKQGLLHRVDMSDKDYSYGAWELTAQGQALLDSLFTPAA